MKLFLKKKEDDLKEMVIFMQAKAMIPEERKQFCGK